ncbi:MAG: PKD domain-containing protein [Bacteroidetes bacterium]|nr:MAG: PKD domain-containing protein [Bacteroidota bacterium]
MKKMKQLLASVALVSAVFFSSCKKKEPPVADFTPSATAIELKDAVTFTDKSANATSYKWEFGDGGTSTEKSPTYQFKKGGTYKVKLTVTNDDGSSTKEATVQVKGYFLKNVTITAFNADSDANTAGVQPWDTDGTTADVTMSMGPYNGATSGSPWDFNKGLFVFESGVEDNAVGPFTWTWGSTLATSDFGLLASGTATSYTAGPIELTTGDYYLAFYDEDGTTPNFTYQTMFGSTAFKGLINNGNTAGAGGAPINFFTSTNGTTATFAFTANSGAWNVSMTFDVRLP